MNTEKIKELADNAEVIICGYAFSKCENGISVVNLNAPDHAAVFSNEGEMLETSMDDIELSIVRDYLEKSKKYMECENA
ncbi:DUF7723 family protein [Treponema succinifaciens]|uniref:DUF7723 family protein n=1 Tax=Treponema succinifaciens TaxID=167 RepID=UPI00259910BD|nr:hypothetical protein [uncultured Treponema sp.]